MKRLDERVAVITGAASGIGRVTAARLANEGAVAVVTDVQDALGEESAAEITSSGGKASFVHHDVTSESEWQAVVKQVLADHGRLDILVNNAGMGDLAPIEETTMAEYERTIAIDQTGVFLGMKVCAQALKASGHGSVINISSTSGTSGGNGTSPAYHAAKGAVRMLTKNVAIHWAMEGVRVNSVHPASTASRSWIRQRGRRAGCDDGVDADGAPRRAARDRSRGASLASDDASFVTGCGLDVDGGFIAR